MNTSSQEKLFEEIQNSFSKLFLIVSVRMRRRILDYYRYELPENLFDKILLFFLGLFFIVSLITAVMVGNGIRNQEKAIIQLRHEIDSICSCIGKEIPAGGHQTCFPSEYGKDFWGKDEL